MPASNLLGVVLALASAVVWGGGDFSGGVAARRSHPFQVLALSALSGIAILFAFAIARGETLSAFTSVLWALAAGGSGALGIAALYRGLALGRAASVAPTAAVVSASLPVLFSALTEGLPALTQMAGFAVAIPGIWLVSRSATDRATERGTRELVLALLAGAGFGGFFILIAQVERGAIFAPLVIARSMTLGVGLLLMWIRRMRMPNMLDHPIALLAGVLDAGGNVLYLLAQQFTRVDVAAVLSSLYPASTVLLARFVLKEQVSSMQWAGLALCLVAVTLIAL
jgi:drug/metabolite transporter (DMT)-like permease